MQEVLAGRTEAYGEIFQRYRRQAYGLALQYLRNKQDAMDLVQDAFIQAYRKLRKFDPSRDFGRWFLTIVRNLAIDRLRRRKRRAAEELQEHFPDQGPDQAELRVLQHELWAALGKLSEPHREILYLKEYEGYSYAEIAEILSVPLGTVMSRLHHARKNLAALLSERRHEMWGD